MIRKSDLWGEFERKAEDEFVDRILKVKERNVNTNFDKVLYYLKNYDCVIDTK